MFESGRPIAHVAGHSIAYSYKERGPALVLSLYLPSGIFIQAFEPEHLDLLQLYLVRIGYIGVITISLAAFAFTQRWYMRGLQEGALKY